MDNYGAGLEMCDEDYLHTDKEAANAHTPLLPGSGADRRRTDDDRRSVRVHSFCYFFCAFALLVFFVHVLSDKVRYKTLHVLALGSSDSTMNVRRLPLRGEHSLTLRRLTSTGPSQTTSTSSTVAIGRFETAILASAKLRSGSPCPRTSSSRSLADRARMASFVSGRATIRLTMFASKSRLIRKFLPDWITRRPACPGAMAATVLRVLVSS